MSKKPLSLNQAPSSGMANLKLNNSGQAGSSNQSILRNSLAPLSETRSSRTTVQYSAPQIDPQSIQPELEEVKKNFNNFINKIIKTFPKQSTANMQNMTCSNIIGSSESMATRQLHNYITKKFDGYHFKLLQYAAMCVFPASMENRLLQIEMHKYYMTYNPEALTDFKNKLKEIRKKSLSNLSDPLDTSNDGEFLRAIIFEHLTRNLSDIIHNPNIITCTKNHETLTENEQSIFKWSEGYKKMSAARNEALITLALFMQKLQESQSTHAEYMATIIQAYRLLHSLKFNFTAIEVAAYLKDMGLKLNKFDTYAIANLGKEKNINELLQELYSKFTLKRFIFMLYLKVKKHGILS